MISFILNQKEIRTPVEPGTTLLDFIRYHQHLTGTKIGCREGDCGACTVLTGEIKNGSLIYSSATSCLMPIGNARGKHIVTVEGINTEGLNAVQQAFSNEGATQCGFCTPGFVVSLAGFCLSDKQPSYSAAIDAMNGNICRCTGYKSIERAAGTINDRMQERNNEDAIRFAVDNGIIPSYFLTIKERLLQIDTDFIAAIKTGNKYLGGGTDLYVQQHDTIVHEKPEFLFGRQQMKGITQRGNTCEMGASTTVTDISESAIFKKYFPFLARYIKLVSSTQIRNMATIAGNFINASPIGDFTIFFLALDAQLTLTDGTTKRTVPLRKLYKGYKDLDKKPEEYVEKIHFELPAENDGFHFEKVSKRTCLDIASVNTAIYLKMDGDTIINAGLSAGGVGPVPTFLAASCKQLCGKKISAELVKEVINIAQSEVTPISDARGTAAYKRLLLAQLIKAHFIHLFPSLPLQKIVEY